MSRETNVRCRGSRKIKVNCNGVEVMERDCGGCNDCTPPPDTAVRLTARSAAHAIQDDMLTNSKGHADTLEIIQRHIEARDRSHTDELREAVELLRGVHAPHPQPELCRACIFLIEHPSSKGTPR